MQFNQNSVQLFLTNLSSAYFTGLEDQFRASKKITSSKICVSFFHSPNSTKKPVAQQKQKQPQQKQGKKAAGGGQKSSSQQQQQQSGQAQHKKETGPNPLKRGQKAKMKRIRQKYGDQDEEERQLRQRLIQVRLTSIFRVIRISFVECRLP